MNAIVQPKIADRKRTPLQEVVPLPAPFSIQLDVADVCNMRCKFCFQSDKEALKRHHVKLGIMDYTLFTKIIDDMKDSFVPHNNIRRGGG